MTTYRIAQRLRKRRRLAITSAAVALMAGVSGLITLGASDEGSQQLTSTGPPNVDTTTTSTTEPTQVDSTTVGPPASPAPPAKPKSMTTTTTTIVCRNSYDPICGEFYWDPEPVNQPMTVEIISVSPTNPQVGETVTFSVRVGDDAGLTSGGCSNSRSSYGDGSEDPICIAGCPIRGPSPTGPWDPPPNEFRYFQEDFTHIYTEPGTFTFSYSADSNPLCQREWPASNPYASYAAASTTITVTGEPLTTTTTVDQ